MLETAVGITQVLLAIGALCAVYRVYRGPSVLDRVISVDVILIIVASVMLVEMVRSDHQDFILFVLVTSVIGFLGAVAIARYVVARKPADADRAVERDAQAAGMEEPEPEAPQEVAAAPVMTAFQESEDEATSWFTALAKSGFAPQRGKDPARGGATGGDAGGATGGDAANSAENAAGNSGNAENSGEGAAGEDAGESAGGEGSSGGGSAERPKGER